MWIPIRSRITSNEHRSPTCVNSASTCRSAAHRAREVALGGTNFKRAGGSTNRVISHAQAIRRRARPCGSPMLHRPDARRARGAPDRASDTVALERTHEPFDEASTTSRPGAPQKSIATTREPVFQLGDLRFDRGERIGIESLSLQRLRDLAARLGDRRVVRAADLDEATPDLVVGHTVDERPFAERRLPTELDDLAATH